METHKKSSKSIYWIIVFFIFLLSFGLAKAQCPNLNLTYGNFTNWQCYHGSCASGNYSCVPTQPIPGNHTILNAAQLIAANDLYDGKCNVIKKVPDGYAYSIQLGNDGVGAQVDAVTYRLTIDSSNDLLILSFAWVMQNPEAHSDQEQPLFMMCIYDTNGHQLNLPCGCVNFVSSKLLQGLACTTEPLGKDWTTVGFSLEPLIGQTIIIRYEVRDCTLSGHYGYAYLVAECRPMTIDLTYCEGQNAARLKAPEGFISYVWSRTSQPDWHAYTRQINIQNPLDGEEFTCTIQSELGCTSTLRTIIAKTSIDASFVYGVKENGGVDIEDPNHCDQYGIFKNYYDTCSRTATFVDMSYVVNSKKDNIEWSSPCRTKVNGRNDTTSSFLNFVSADSLYTFTFPDPGLEGNDPIDYLIRLLVFTENGCGNQSDSTAEHWIRIYPSPIVEIVGDENMCEGNTALLTAHTVKSYLVDYKWTYWRDSNNRQTPFYHYGDSLTIHGPGLYILEAKDSVGCYAYDTLEVKPLEPQMEITKTDVNCYGECTGSFKPGKITGILVLMDAYWVLKDINGNDSIIDVTAWAMNGSPMPFTNLSAGTYTFYATDPTGCDLRKDVVINQPPLLESTTNSQATTCNSNNGVAIVIPTGGTPPYKYLWKDAQGTTKGTQDNIRNIYTGWYYVTITDANDCIRIDSVFVDALPFPVINIDSIKIETCDDENGYAKVHVDYAASPVTYTWLENSTKDSILNYVKAGTYHLTITDANGCQADTQLIIGSYPPINLIGIVTPETCGRGDGTIKVKAISAAPETVTYVWSGDPTNISNEKGDSVGGLEHGNYMVIVKDTLCYAMTTFEVEHVDGPDANYEVVSYSVASNSIFTLTDASKGTCTYWCWDMGDGNTQEGKVIYYTYENAGDYIVLLEVMDANGCIDTISKIIHVYDELNVFIPNTFTPNKDGLNDTWAPVINETNENGYQLSIFDRWGNKIFYSNDPKVRWDGKVAGKFVENNTVYTYRLIVRDYMGQEYKYVGHVLVLR